MKGPRAGGKTALIIDYALGNTGNLRLFPASLFIGHWTRACPISNEERCLKQSYCTCTTITIDSGPQKHDYFKMKHR